MTSSITENAPPDSSPETRTVISLLPRKRMDRVVPVSAAIDVIVHLPSVWRVARAQLREQGLDSPHHRGLRARCAQARLVLDRDPRARATEISEHAGRAIQLRAAEAGHLAPQRATNRLGARRSVLAAHGSAGRGVQQRARESRPLLEALRGLAKAGGDSFVTDFDGQLQQLAPNPLACRGEEIGACWEVAVERAARDAGFAGEIVHRDVVGVAGLEVDDECLE